MAEAGVARAESDVRGHVSLALMYEVRAGVAHGADGHSGMLA